MTSTATSINGIPIRLPDERWQHIIQRHTDLTTQKDLLLQTIAAPIRILEGNDSALMAIREIQAGKMGSRNLPGRRTRWFCCDSFLNSQNQFA